MRFLCACAVLFALVLVNGMDLQHYDLDSFTFLSTDIVIANRAKTLPVEDNAPTHFIATVDRTLYGALRPGEKLDKLSEFLSFSYPMEDGQRGVLFLDRRPHRPNYFFPEASISPYVVVPSGLYLVDQYGHVHKFYQPSNPGPYVAEGYDLHVSGFLPSKETDLRLPSLSDVEHRIADSLKSTQLIHSLLDKAAVHDKRALVDLLQARLQLAASPCSLRFDATAQTIATKLHSIFYSPPMERKTKLSRPGFHEQNNSADPIANHFLASSSPQFRSTVPSIFDDDADDPRTEKLDTECAYTDQPEVLTDMKQVYARTGSGTLRFAIEESFLDISDDLYFSLNPGCGPVATMVRQAGDGDCVKASPGTIAFIAIFHLSKQSAAQFGQQPRYISC